MEHSEDIKDIAAALSKAQGEIQNVVKDAKNPHYKSEYASLDAVTDTVRPIFSKHGLAVVQIPSFADGIVTVDTMLTHTSGQWIKGYPAAPLGKPDAQGVGSATTYLRRYSLAGIAAIAQTDDDGNMAQPARPVDELVNELPDEPPHPAAEPQTRAQQVAEGGPYLYVTEVKIAKRGSNSKGPWTLYAVRFSNGTEGTTFDERLYNTALVAKEQGVAVDPQISGKNLIKLKGAA